MKYMQNTHDYYWLYGIICVNLQSLLAIAEWIEISSEPGQGSQKVSLLAIAEWIEIPQIQNYHPMISVSASDSGVD